MHTTDLIRRITAQDYTVQTEVQEAGPAVAPAIASLLHHPDDNVRMLAAHCLALAGGPTAGPMLLGAVGDPALTVAGAALSGLAKLDLGAQPAIVTSLIGKLGETLEPVIRQRIPIVLIQSGAAPNIEELKQLAVGEADPQVREDLLLLLAKFGNGDVRKEVAGLVEQARGRAVQRWTQRFEIVQGWWLVRPLVSWLDLEEPAKRVGVDGIPDIPESIRACDVAVNLLVEWTGVKLSFQLSPFSLYTFEQRNEVRNLVSAWLAVHTGVL